MFLLLEKLHGGHCALTTLPNGPPCQGMALYLYSSPKHALRSLIRFNLLRQRAHQAGAFFPQIVSWGSTFDPPKTMMIDPGCDPGSAAACRSAPPRLRTRRCRARRDHDGGHGWGQSLPTRHCCRKAAAISAWVFLRSDAGSLFFPRGHLRFWASPLPRGDPGRLRLSTTKAAMWSSWISGVGRCDSLDSIKAVTNRDLGHPPACQAPTRRGR